MLDLWGPRELVEALVSREWQVFLVMLGQREPQERQDLLVLLDFKAFRDKLDQTVNFCEIIQNILIHFLKRFFKSNVLYKRIMNCLIVSIFCLQKKCIFPTFNLFATFQGHLEALDLQDKLVREATQGPLVYLDLQEFKDPEGRREVQEGQETPASQELSDQAEELDLMELQVMFLFNYLFF